MARLLIRALIATCHEDIQKIPLSGHLSKLGNQPWRRLTLELDSSKEDTKDAKDSKDSSALPTTLFYPADGSIPRDFGLSVERVTLYPDRQLVHTQGKNFRILEAFDSPSLLAAIPLLKAKLEPSAELLAGFSRTQNLSEAIHAALMLGCGEISIATLPLGEHSERMGRFLLKLSSPSLFLMEEWFAKGQPLYRSTSSRGAWSKVGWRHPWEEWFSRPGFLQTTPKDALILIDPEGWSTLPQQAFQDLFQRANFKLDGATSVDWEAPQKSTQFTIPIHWGARATPADPTLWILSEDDLDHLEKLLGGLPEADLGNLQLACLEDEDGEPLFVVREVIRKNSQQLLSFARAFGNYAGFGNLYLPIERTLEPPIRRDRYPGLFDLQPNTITLLDSGPRAKHKRRAPMKVIRIPEGSLQPLSSLITYRVQAARQTLQSILDQSVLDLGQFAKLPKRPLPARSQASKEESLSSPRKKPKETPKAYKPPPLKRQKKAAIPTPKTKAKAPVYLLELPPKPPETREIEILEKAAVAALEDPQAWSALARLQREGASFEQSIACLEHALWLSSESDSPELWQEIEATLQLVERCGKTTRAMGSRVAVIQFIEAAPSLTVRAMATQLPAVISQLRNTSVVLSKKARWLLWSKLLQLSGDHIEMEHLRESILGELSLRGIEEIDSFPFIRRHLRSAQHEGESSPELRKLLQTIGSEITQIQQRSLNIEVLGSLAVGLEIAGDGESAQALIRDWRGHLNALPSNHGAIAFATFGAAAARLGLKQAEGLFEESLRRFSNMRNGFEKDRALIDLLQQLQHASLLSAERRIAMKILAEIQAQKPHRQCLQLLDAATHLLDLGVAAEASAILLSLLEKPEIQQDTYYLEHALRALVIFQSGRPPEPVLAQTLLTALLSQEDTIDESSACAIDHTLSALSTEALEQVRQATKQHSAFSSLMLQTCIVRSLADKGETDQGLALSKSLLQDIWRLENPKEIGNALQRAVPNLSHLGRVKEGMEMIRGVLSNLERRQGPTSMSLRDRGEILAACAMSAGKLGEKEGAMKLLGEVITAFEEMIDPQGQGVSHLFEILGLVVREIISLDEIQQGAVLIERAVTTITQRLLQAQGSDHPYFVHQARIQCALALCSLEKTQRGVDLLRTSVQNIAGVRAFDGRDRVDLLLEALQALTLAQIDEKTRAQLLEQIVKIGVGKEAPGSYSDVFRRDLLRKTIHEVVQRQTAYRLALQKIRAGEERLIRTRITSPRDFKTVR